MDLRIMLATVVLDCLDAKALASFYASLLGWEVSEVEPDWVLMRNPQGGAGLSFQSEPGYVTPTWPEEPEQQQKMLHLDFLVEDLDAAIAHAVSAGATVSPHQYLDGVAVLFDPAGHPFCLFIDPDYVWPGDSPHAQVQAVGTSTDIKWVSDPELREDVSREIMHRLRIWFNPASDIDAKAVLHRDMPFAAAFREGHPVGFLALKPHNQYTFEIFNMGVLEDYQGSGLGSMLIESACAYCHGEGSRFLTVKTLDASVDYEPYEKTRAFYRRRGFLPLEVFKSYWDEDNPCLFMARYLG
ncbi:MAG TPA: GNAT family N-acetyltransferase [Bacillota bacterium]|jgi:GNAT superfamily N-acetyltransferase/predicted enzyme related to lactoylglutathione lyase|nr:GNAT family N-acetyltransferase [Bacillota bacterium]